MTWQPPRAPRGVDDILPDQVPAWRRIETTARDVCERYGYREIRIPLFESTELYVRGMGEVTDVVEKEMFCVSGSAKAAPEGKEREDFSLRPEFTAGIVRAYREHSLDKRVGFMKVYAMGPLFRYERPQKGRLRQFHQINVEALATSDPYVDVEAIALARDIVTGLGIPGFRVRLNSIGHEAPECRQAYRDLLKERLAPRLGELCDLCKQRYERNIFRVLDCKRCAEKTADLPPMAEHLCAPCAEHFATVKAGLERLDVRFAVDARLVRGFDYYTHTVFEFPCDRLGAQDALGGGGRYDKLIPDMGGPDVGACGFALGMERILLALADPAEKQAGAPAAVAVRPKAVFVAATPDPRARGAAFDLAQRLRAAGLEADLDHEGRSLKSQLKGANKEGFGF
ncbi:MAG TPA: histidine--tRNA ligase, partial [Planctomycetota bacterium]|nr:histidine--tRNA ligase [Planctomycetota bacterium]